MKHVHLNDGLRFRYGVFRRAATGWQACDLVAPGDELVLLAEATAGADFSGDAVQVTIELYRGDSLRDRRCEDVEFCTGKRWRTAFRLGWSDRPGASTRLWCRILADGRRVGDLRVLIGGPQVDAQGRIEQPREEEASPQTMIAYEECLLARIRRGETD